MRFPLQLAAVLCHLLLATGIAAQPGQPLSETEIYEKYRSWTTQQTPDAEVDSAEGLDHYRAFLAGEGLDEPEVERHLTVITEHGHRRRAERWNRILTSPSPRFNIEPNAFLAAMIENVPPGKALDVGMGQGRNAIYLAARGWQVTGFDPAGEAVVAAAAEAHRLGLALETHVLRDDEFDFGTERWDLIVLSYVALRDLIPILHRSLKPGGLVVVEAFHRDATANASIGSGVVFDTNELPRLFDPFRILRYEDVNDVADFGRRQTRLVRLLAQKPPPRAQNAPVPSAAPPRDPPF